MGKGAPELYGGVAPPLWSVMVGLKDFIEHTAVDEDVATDLAAVETAV